jgi:hypothetical protein
MVGEPQRDNDDQRDRRLIRRAVRRTNKGVPQILPARLFLWDVMQKSSLRFFAKSRDKTRI